MRVPSTSFRHFFSEAMLFVVVGAVFAGVSRAHEVVVVFQIDHVPEAQVSLSRCLIPIPADSLEVRP